MAVGRGEFVGGALAGGTLALVAPRGAQGAEAKIEVLLNEPVGTISPNIYSHFVEHLGGVVYDGIWVGERSRVPNTGGIRTAIVEALRRIKAPVIRYPGGCFAGAIRAELVRHERVHAVLPANGRAAVHGREPSEPPGAGLLRVGRVL